MIAPDIANRAPNNSTGIFHAFFRVSSRRVARRGCRAARDRRFGTPAYVYSAAALRDAAPRFRAALAGVERKHLAFAVKANPNLAALRLLAD